MADIPIDFAARVAAGEKNGSLAERYGVTTRTIYNWCNHPEVKAAIQEEQGYLQRATRARLIKHQDDAMRTIIDVMCGEEHPAATRLAAAFGILDRSGAAKSADLNITGDLAVGVATTESTPDLAERLARRLAGIIPVAGDDEDEGAGSNEG